MLTTSRRKRSRRTRANPPSTKLPGAGPTRISSAMVPWFVSRTSDRGWALEEKWSAGNNLSPNGRDTFLSAWAARGAAIPALIFNAMLVEPGRHVIFSTTDFPKANDPRGIVNFYTLYRDRIGGYDIRVNTATRLSSSF